MLTMAGQAVLGLLLLYVGGQLLVRGASALASRLGVSPLAIGLTVVAFGTSAPELVVSVDAANARMSDIALGNVVGSNIANITLILGVAALIRPISVEARIIRVDAPIMILASLALMAVMANGQASRLEGLLLIIALVAYTVFTFHEARKETRRVRDEFASGVARPQTGLPVQGLLVILGLSGLVAGAHFLVASAAALAASLGISQAAIGLTVVAVGTSLPELTTSLVAATRGHGDIAVGNVIGSNIFNVLGILGVTAALHPLEMGAITWLDLGLMLALACVATAFLLTRLRLARVEGAALVLCFVVYSGWLLSA